MKIEWKISSKDIKYVQDFYKAIKDEKFVQDRIGLNIERKKKPVISKTRAWYVLIGCLLTTQQRSGPQSNIDEFLNKNPFPLSYKTCLSKRNNVKNYSRKILSDFGGFRFTNEIPLRIDRNLTHLEEGLWNDILPKLRALLKDTTQDLERRDFEREIADYIDDDDRFYGFGPKQSRNFLQWLGLSRYEIPIDSRVVRWLKKFEFPSALGADALSDKNYYHFVSDGIQELCRASNIYPCALDAAIFISLNNKNRVKK